MQTCFSEFQGKIILKCPKFETRWLAHASRIEAPAIVLLGVHHGAFRQKELCSVDVAIFCRVLQRHGASGAFPRKPVGHCGLPADHGAGTDAVRMTTEVVGMLSSMPVQPTNERWMFWIQHLQTVQSKIYSHTITNTSNKVHGMLFPTNYLQWNAAYC